MRKLITISFIIFNLINAQASTPHHAEYFQQYVKYDMAVELDTYLHRLDVAETLLYTNNSPDTLSEIYFYLYLNKYRKHSLANPEYNEDHGSITVYKILENDSLNDRQSIDETIMKLHLLNPLPPGYSVRFKFEFASILPPASGRYGYQGYHYDVGNWFVTPVVYDRYGWHLNQHLDNEFYQEWGDFNVAVTVPKGYLLGATGDLVNPEIAYLDTLEENREWFIVHPEDSAKTVWEFQAMNVHDFAWTADPSYRLRQSQWNGITLNVLIMDYNLNSWSDMTDWGIKGIQFFCENYGMYPYKQLTVADTYIRAGGIEYPQIVMINDYINPEFESLYFKAVVFHEIAHNWYYGLLGNNQTEKEWLDEGFTTFAEINVMEAVFGREGNMNPGDRGWFAETFGHSNDDRKDNAYSYLRLAKFGLFEDQINLPPDYMGFSGYALSYAKTADVLFMLQYVMGDSLFAKAMLTYFDQWKMKHPYPEDFFSVMEKTANRDLDWFFEQWLNTNRLLDYAVGGYSGRWESSAGNKIYTANVNFERIEKIFMPIDFEVHLKNGAVKKYQVPVDNFPKQEKDREVLPYWHFSQKKYTAGLSLPAEIDYIEIDPSLRLMDVNRLNNVSTFLPPMEFHFMKSQHLAPPLDKYLWEFWPAAAYNEYDKLKIGFKLDGGYLDIDHLSNSALFYNTARGTADFDLRYSTPVKWPDRFTGIEGRLFSLDGRQGGELGLQHTILTESRRTYTFRYGVRNSLLFRPEYLASPWDRRNVNVIYGCWNSRPRRYNNSNSITTHEVQMQTSIFGSSFDFSQIYGEWKGHFPLSRNEWALDMRFFAGYGEGDIPLQHQFNLASANGWDEFSQPFYRSRGALPYPLKRDGHLYMAGGGNVRGYSLPETGSDILGDKIVAANFELRWPNPLEVFSWNPLHDFSFYIFADAGSVFNDAFPGIEDFAKSSGVSIAWEPPVIFDYAFHLQKIRFDFPLWLSHPGAGEDNTQFRWLLSFEFSEE